MNNIIRYKSVTSTNDIAKKLARSGYPELSIIVAQSQSQGRGRRGKDWHSPAGKGLYCSIILQPDFSLDHIWFFSLLSGLIVCEAVASLTDLSPGLKWPNDVMVERRKLAGVLIESTVNRQRITNIIIGIGINFDFSQIEMAKLDNSATCLSLLTDRVIDADQLLQEIITSLQKYYFNSKLLIEPQRLVELWNEKCVHLGMNVVLYSAAEKYFGKFIAVDNQARAIVEIDHKIKKFTSGDLSLREI